MPKLPEASETSRQQYLTCHSIRFFPWGTWGNLILWEWCCPWRAPFFCRGTSDLTFTSSLRDNPKVKVTYYLRNGTMIHSSTFIKCDDQPGIDLCVVRLDIRPHYWFPLKIKLPATYTSLYLIGNPVDKDFDIIAGRLFLPSTPQATDLRRLEVSVPVRPGFSGGPIFDDEGKLVCVASELRYSHTLIGINWQPDPALFIFLSRPASSEIY